MKSFKLGDFTPETVDALIEFSNNYWEDDWTIFLNSNGGGVWELGQIEAILNGKNNIKIVVNLAYSAAFLLLLTTPHPVEFVLGARGMIHLPARTQMITCIDKPYCTGDNYNEVLRKEGQGYKQFYDSYLQKVLTKKEFQDYEMGKEVYFDYSRLVKTFKNGK